MMQGKKDAVLGFRDGRGHRTRSAGSFQKLEKAKEGAQPQASRRKPCQYLDCSLVRTIVDSRLPNKFVSVQFSS